MTVLVLCAGCGLKAESGNRSAQETKPGPVTTGVTTGDVKGVVSTEVKSATSSINSQITGMRDWMVAGLVLVCILCMACIVLTVLHGYTAGKKRWMAAMELRGRNLKPGDCPPPP